jgi:hypothetical protein
MSAPLTTRLHRTGETVVAKVYKGDTVPVTYSNRTQAHAKAIELQRQGIPAVVIVRGRPFYVKIEQKEVTGVHVTRVNGSDVYGHDIKHCNAAGCAGNELYWGIFPGTIAGLIYELSHNTDGDGIAKESE